MRIPLTVALLAVAAPGHAAEGPTPALPASASLDKAIAVTKDQAYRSSRVDWPAVETEARSVEQAQGEDAAIRYVVRALGDPHTWYEAPAASRPPAAAPAAAATTAKGAERGPRPIAVALPAEQGIPVLRINAWSGTDRTGATASVRSALMDVLQRSSCGVVLDFAQNEGGNMWPMLVGLAPLLDEGRLGAFRSAKGVETAIERRGEKIFIDGQEHYLNQAANQWPQRLPKFVALVIGQRSASSGEITPIMFLGQSNVRSFGTPTAGYSTANTPVQLPNGGMLVLTTSATVDRAGKEYVERIVPDVQSEQAIEDAAAWVQAQCRR